MSFRRVPIERPVELLHDGDVVYARPGESLAEALLGVDRVVFSRSPKLHRPRGPYCLRAACEGCIVRVDGVPNVMACRYRVRGGETVETQNVVGSREVDLLSATDFLFPHGVDPHRLLAGVRGASAIVTRLARRVSGLGRLPDVERAPVPATRRDVDVLVVGGGGAGLAVAAELGARKLLVDEGATLGGALLRLDPDYARALGERAHAARVELRSNAAVLAVYREPDDGTGRLSALIAGEPGLEWVRARAVVVATGGHAPVPAFGNGDLPGIFSARAGLELSSSGIAPGERVAVVGSGPFTKAALTALGTLAIAHFPEPSHVERATGKLRVRGLVVTTPEGQRRVRVDAVLFDGPLAPAFELAVQAGGRVRFTPGVGYLPELDGESRAAAGVWCAGRVTGAPLPAGEAARIAASIRSFLAG
ncbi:MAG: 2Fe-2S iron-sulfur cluster-binding protein [Pseudomonadota bacterium]